MSLKTDIENMKKMNKIADIYVLKRFSLIFIPLFLLTSAVTYYSYHVESENDRIFTEVNEVQFLDHIEDVVVHDFQFITSDLKIMTKSHTLQALLDGHSSAQSKLSEDWLVLAESKASYDQLRFIDNHGQEVIRVDYRNGRPIIVPTDQLQNKKDRYYFTDTLRLGKDDIFVSPLDLNIEHGQIEQPLKPMIRFGAPVFDRSGQKRGIVLLNYLGEHLIKWFKGAKEESLQRERMLLNSDGYWLAGPDTVHAWGFMYDNPETFGRKYPEAWAQIQANAKGQFISNQGLFTFVKIHPLADSWHTSAGSPRPDEVSKGIIHAQDFHWIAVTYISAASMAVANHALLINLLWLFSLFTLVLAIVSGLLAISSARRNAAFAALAISEKKLKISSKQYQELNRQFQGLLEGIEDSILIVDPDMNIIWSNNRHTYDNEADFEGSSLLGKSCTVGCADGTLITTCFESGLPQQDQVTCDNGKSWMIRAFPVIDNAGKVVTVILIEQDITEFLQLQVQSVRTGQLAALGEMAAGVAHEINNPIGGVINYAQILRNRSVEKSETAELAERIMKEGERIVKIVQTLLFCAQENDGDLSLCSLPDVLNEVFDLTRVQIKQAGIRLSISLSDELPLIGGNPQQLHQLFVNIVSNARYALAGKYSASHENNVLEVIAENYEGGTERYVRVQFTDYGVGIPESLMERIMRPFFTTKAAGVGTGLGLSISHEIVKKHQGRMNIESTEGEFTRVTVDLPVTGARDQLQGLRLVTSGG